MPPLRYAIDAMPDYAITLPPLFATLPPLICHASADMLADADMPLFSPPFTPLITPLMIFFRYAAATPLDMLFA